MSVSISVAFTQHFGADVKLDYQQFGARLRNTVRNRDFMPGEKTRFQRASKGSATQKARHADIPPMNLGHAWVDLTLQDWWAGDFIDEFDENKTNIDERDVQVRSQSGALGRTVDKLIRDQFYLPTGSGGSRKYLASVAQPVDLDLLLKIEEDFNGRDIPADAQRYWAVGAKTWSRLMVIPQFANQDWIGADALPYKLGMSAKRWNTMFVFMHGGPDGVAVDGGSDERTMAYHQTAVGWGSRGTDLKPDWDWEGTKRAWFVSHGFEGGSVIIDNEGALEVVADVT